MANEASAGAVLGPDGRAPGARGARWLGVRALCIVLLTTCVARSAEATCAGDCSARGRVTIGDLITAVNIALGLTAASECPAADADGDGAVVVSELIAAVGHALEGCPATAAFIPLGQVPGGRVTEAHAVSDDGSTVVGTAVVGGLTTAFRWRHDTGAVAILGAVPASAWGVDAQGDTVVGQLFEPLEQAYRWTAAGGLVRLPFLAAGHNVSQARGVSADGAIVVGLSALTILDARAVLWDAEGNPEAFAEAATQGLAITPDAMAAAGSNQLNGEGFRWHRATGPEALGVPDGALGSTPIAISDDGNVICGESGTSSAALVAFCWHADSGIEALPSLPGGSADSDNGMGVSADGAIVVGSNRVGPIDGMVPVAVLWDAAGVHPVGDLLRGRGVVLDGWRLDYASDITPDGRTIVGGGVAPDGQRTAWLAVLATE